MNRISNLLIASAGLLVLLLPLLLIAALIRVTLGSPVFFRQVRPGLLGQPFELIKFRTLADKRDANGELLPDDQRMTRLGSFLRRTSIDELPELWNVIVGEMNLVGPRPLLMEYLPLYTPEQNRRHEVPPGITGWAQIKGRNRLSWEEKFELDLWYVENRAAWLDIKIILLTVLALFRTSETRQEGHVTADKFKGQQ